MPSRLHVLKFFTHCVKTFLSGTTPPFPCPQRLHFKEGERKDGTEVGQTEKTEKGQTKTEKKRFTVHPPQALPAFGPTTTVFPLHGKSTHDTCTQENINVHRQLTHAQGKSHVV
jgi:hypothetical protein